MAAVQENTITEIITIWNYCHKTATDKIRCNSCMQTYTSQKRMAIHLYHDHKIKIETEISIWENDNDSVWNYFTKTNFYIAQCKKCGFEFTSAYNKNGLRCHLYNRHTTIINTMKNEIDSYTWVLKYYVIEINKYNIYDMYCKLCKHIRFYLHEGINPLRAHLIQTHHINKSEFYVKTGDYNMDTTVQQPVAQENYPAYYFQYTTSNYDNTHSQALRSQDNQNRETGEYNVNAMIQQSVTQENYPAYYFQYTYISNYDNTHSQALGNQDNQNRETGEYNVDAMIQQPVVQENYPITTSNYDNTHSQASGSQDNQNRETGEYNVDAMIQQPVVQENYPITTFNYDNTHSQASGSQDNQNRQIEDYYKWIDEWMKQ